MAISAGTLGVVPAAPAPPARGGLAAGTRVLLEAPIPGTLLRLAAPNVVVIAVQAAINVLEAVYVGWLGRDALAGIALVFPLVMLMQTMSAGGMGVGIASAIARALGGGRRRDADALVVHALAIALVLGAAFTVGMLWGGPRLYRAMGGTDGALAAALTYSNVVFACAWRCSATSSGWGCRARSTRSRRISRSWCSPASSAPSARWRWPVTAPALVSNICRSPSCSGSARRS